MIDADVRSAIYCCSHPFRSQRTRVTMLKSIRRRSLSVHDNEAQTLGCRSANPNHCRNSYTPGKCAFVRADDICLMPPRSWRTLLAELRDASVNGMDRTDGAAQTGMASVHHQTD